MAQAAATSENEPKQEEKKNNGESASQTPQQPQQPTENQNTNGEPNYEIWKSKKTLADGTINIRYQAVVEVVQYFNNNEVLTKGKFMTGWQPGDEYPIYGDLLGGEEEEEPLDFNLVKYVIDDNDEKSDGQKRFSEQKFPVFFFILLAKEMHIAGQEFLGMIPHSFEKMINEDGKEDEERFKWAVTGVESKYVQDGYLIKDNVLTQFYLALKKDSNLSQAFEDFLKKMEAPDVVERSVVMNLM